MQGQRGRTYLYDLSPGQEVHARNLTPLPYILSHPTTGQEAFDRVQRSDSQLQKAVQLEGDRCWAEAYAQLRKVQAEGQDPWKAEIMDALQRVGSHGRRSGLHDISLCRTFSGHTGRVFDCTLHPDGKTLFSCSDDGVLKTWDLWQGQTPAVPYIEERCHYTFRWWYEYSGGKVTDWGAHDIDIAQWAIDELPIAIDGKAELPKIANGYNVATQFNAVVRYPSGTVLEIGDSGRQGTMFEGDQGRIFVNRGDVEGKPVEELKDQPLAREQFKLYAHDNLARPPRFGKLDAILNHMGNFVDCVKTRNAPVSDVVSQHRSVSVCHLGNISMRLGRKLVWDPEKGQIVGDDEANRLLARPYRAPWVHPDPANV